MRRMLQLPTHHGTTSIATEALPQLDATASGRGESYLEIQSIAGTTAPTATDKTTATNSQNQGMLTNPVNHGQVSRNCACFHAYVHANMPRLLQYARVQKSL